MNYEMTNAELLAAIELAHQMTATTAQRAPTYERIRKHLSTLLDIQASRAAAISMEPCHNALAQAGGAGATEEATGGSTGSPAATGSA